MSNLQGVHKRLCDSRGGIGGARRLLTSNGNNNKCVDHSHSQHSSKGVHNTQYSMAQLKSSTSTFNEGHALIVASVLLAVVGSYATLFSAFLPLSGIPVSLLAAILTSEEQMLKCCVHSNVIYTFISVPDI